MTIDKQAHQSFGQSGSPLEVLLAFGKLGVTCFGGGSTGYRPLQSGLDEFGQGSGRLRDRTRRLCATDRVANAAARRRRHQRARRNSPCIGRIVTCLAG